MTHIRIDNVAQWEALCGVLQPASSFSYRHAVQVWVLGTIAAPGERIPVCHACLVQLALATHEPGKGPQL